MKLWQHLKAWLRFNLELFRLHRQHQHLSAEIWRLEEIEQEMNKVSRYLHHNDPSSSNEMANVNDAIQMRIRALHKDRHANAIHRARVKLQMHKKQVQQ